MKPFSFRLESVLNYRKYQEKKALGDLIRMKNEYNRIKETLKRLAVERLTVAKSCFAEGTGGIEAPRYRLYTSFIQKLAHDMEKGHGELNNSRTKIRTQEAVLKRETIKSKALETLKDHRFNKHLKQAQREEQKALDELVINKRWVQA